MKRKYLLLICCLFLVSACQTHVNDVQTIQTVAPTTYLNQQSKETKRSKKQQNNLGYDFIVERYKLIDSGSNISVDTALDLLISQINPASKIDLKVGQRITFQFKGYVLLEDGNCYLISFGVTSKNKYKEIKQYAISYNKTIYEAPAGSKKTENYVEIYSLDSGITSSNQDITASVENKILYIKNVRNGKTIDTFHLSKYGLDNASTSDIKIMDLNFDNHADVAIYKDKEDSSFTYYAFVYNKSSKKYDYASAFQDLNCPEYNPDNKTITCEELSNTKLTFDVYCVKHNQPEIKSRTLYTYRNKTKQWEMQVFDGADGELVLMNTQFFSTDQVEAQTGQSLKTP